MSSPPYGTEVKMPTSVRIFPFVPKIDQLEKELYGMYYKC